MKSKITELESNEKKVGTNDYSYLLTDKSAQIFRSLSSASVMPPTISSELHVFWKWVGWRYDHTTEIGKIQGFTEEDALPFLPPPGSKALTVCSWALPWEGERPLKAGSNASVSFPGVILWFIIRNGYSFSFPDTRLLKSFTNHLTNIYLKKVSGTLTSDWEMKQKVCLSIEWTWVTSSSYAVK